MRNEQIIIDVHISTHALTEGDLKNWTQTPQRLFQLTPSRRATITKTVKSTCYAFQLTPSRRATLTTPFSSFKLICISTHALTEGDSTSPGAYAATLSISTHALTEGDVRNGVEKICRKYFNSRPHGGRQPQNSYGTAGTYFNSRPHGGRRCTAPYYEGQTDISTHALTEGDKECKNLDIKSMYFNSRPHGGRQARSERRCTAFPISTHALTEGDQSVQKLRSTGNISTHALTEGDGKFRQIFLLNRGYAYSISLYFLPHFISLLPQILSFQQKSFKFQVRIFLLFSVHLAFALQNQCVHHVKSRFCTNMFYFVFVLFTQIVKPQTIGLFIYDFF